MNKIQLNPTDINVVEEKIKEQVIKSFEETTKKEIEEVKEDVVIWF